MIPNLNHKQNLKFSLDKILFIVACTYLMMVIVWLVSQGKLKFPQMANSSNQPTGQQQTLSPEDAKFIAYLQQSLEILERKQQQQKANPKPTSNTTPIQTIKAPPPPLPSSPSTPTTTPQIIEKIYVPVYPQIQQPTVAVNPSSPVIAVKPPSSTRLNVPPPPLPVPSQAPIQPPKPPSTVPILTPEVGLLPEAPPPASSTNNIILVGLLEGGEQSSALFTIEGKTQRVALGEGLGATGWILQSVKNQQAVITRNGTVRSLGVGQNF